jgi:hypothetical protein
MSTIYRFNISLSQQEIYYYYKMDIIGNGIFDFDLNIYKNIMITIILLFI